MMTCIKPLLAFVLLFSFSANAIDNLEIKLRTSYPKDAKSVAEAVNFLLEPVGYELQPFNKYAKGSVDVAFKPITPINRQIRTMSIYDAIQSLIGVENTILVDHENKIVSFRKGVKNDDN